MAIGDQKVFTINDSGVELKITALDNGDGTVKFDIAGVSGAADINALFWSDGNSSTGIESLATAINGKVDNSLNMNGTKEAWDGSFGLSSTGLGKEGTDKATFLTEGNSLSVTQAVDFDSLETLGIRATSVGGSGGGSIKGVGAGFEFIPAPVVDDTPPDYFPTLDHALGYATFYFATDEAAVAAADVKGGPGNGSKGPDGVYTVKVSFDGSAVGTDLDTYYQGILDALVNKGTVTADTVVLGVGIHAGDGKPVESEKYYEVTGPNPLDHLVQNNQVDQVYNYGDLVHA